MSVPKREPNLVQLIDLQTYHSNKDGTLTRNNKKVDRGEMCYFALPYDMPAFLRTYRLLNQEEMPPGNRKVRADSRTMYTNALVGWVAEFDAFAMGVKVLIRIDRGGVLKVFAEDEEGFTKLAEWSKE